MDTAQAITAAIVAIGIFAVLLGIVALMWQINSQSSRLEIKMEEQGKELRAEIAEQGKELRAEIAGQGKELRAEIAKQGKELGAEIAEQGKRVAQSELDQARMNGVNSVLLRQCAHARNAGRRRLTPTRQTHSVPPAATITHPYSFPPLIAGRRARRLIRLRRYRLGRCVSGGGGQ